LRAACKQKRNLGSELQLVPFEFWGDSGKAQGGVT